MYMTFQLRHTAVEFVKYIQPSWSFAQCQTMYRFRPSVCANILPADRVWQFDARPQPWPPMRNSDYDVRATNSHLPPTRVIDYDVRAAACVDAGDLYTYDIRFPLIWQPLPVVVSPDDDSFDLDEVRSLKVYWGQPHALISPIGSISRYIEIETAVDHQNLAPREMASVMLTDMSDSYERMASEQWKHIQREHWQSQLLWQDRRPLCIVPYDGDVAPGCANAIELWRSDLANWYEQYGVRFQQTPSTSDTASSSSSSVYQPLSTPMYLDRLSADHATSTSLTL
jgi:hypothetical protein